MKRPKTSKPKTRKIVVHMPSDDQTVFALLRATSGNMAEVGRRLRVDRHTVAEWVNHKDHTDRRKVYDEIKRGCVSNLLDLSETALERNLKSKNGMVSNRAAAIAMQYTGKGRGYVPASHVESENKEDVTITVVRE